MERAAVILAGGMSERFQRRGEPWVDKALTAVDGRTILERIIVQLQGCVDEIAVSVSREQSKKRYLESLPPSIARDIQILVDDVTSGGPLAGIATSIKHLHAKKLLLLPCDTPFLNPAVVKALFQRIGGNDAAIPVWQNGIPETLTAVYRGGRVRSCCTMFSSAGRRRASDLIRGSSRVKFVSIENDLNVFDPNHRSFVNINYREETTRKSWASLPKSSLNRTFTASISAIQDRDLLTVSNAVKAARRQGDSWWKVVNPVMDYLREKRGFFWLAFVAEETAKSLSQHRRPQPKDREELFETAARAYQSEAHHHLNHGLLALAAHTHLDEAWCWRKASRKHRSRSALGAAASIYARLGLDARKSRTLSTQRPARMRS